MTILWMSISETSAPRAAAMIIHSTELVVVLWETVTGQFNAHTYPLANDKMRYLFALSPGLFDID